MKASSKFGTGGCYTCEDCKRQTRSTGRGDNENCGLCAECFDRMSIENEMSDCGETPERMEEWRALVAECLAKGGNPTTERWWA
jgi:hypothetical protein